MLSVSFEKTAEQPLFRPYFPRYDTGIMIRIIPALMIAPAAILLAGPIHAVDYMTVLQAQALCFPAAMFKEAPLTLTPDQIRKIESRSGAEVTLKNPQIWRVFSSGKLTGWFFVDEVIGKYQQITYCIALLPDGSIKQVEILSYREIHGSNVRGAWRTQFKGKTVASPLEIGKDILNLSGATLSSRHLSEGIKRILVTYDIAINR